MTHSVEFKIRIDKSDYTVNQQYITGQELLELAKRLPVDQYELREKLKGGKTQKIDLSDTIDLGEHGIERFMTLPLDQQEG